jgi:protein arginine N-methyltransferase 2
MMGWEEPLMVIHAKVIAPNPGKKVLNVGFGLGIIDMELQKLSPSEHTIIEAHPDVYKKMIQDGWDKKPGVKIIFGRWQDVMDQLEVYDGIFFGNLSTTRIVQRTHAKLEQTRLGNFTMT